MPKSDVARLLYMLDAAREATLLTRCRSRQDLDRDRALGRRVLDGVDSFMAGARRTDDITLVLIRCN